MLRYIASLLAATLLSGCASTSSQRIAAIDRVLADAPGQAQPSAVIATEIALARTAREEGQWAALLDFAAPGAVLHLADGGVGAETALRGRPNPVTPAQPTTIAVWMSCDGQSAVSHGKYADPDGQRGYYAAAWQRQRDGAYRWSYALAAPDPALTARETRVRGTTDPADAIVVEGNMMIRGETGDCLRGAPAPPPARGGTLEGAAGGSGASPDNTLVWRWHNRADGSRELEVSQYRAAGWEQVLAMTVGSNGEVSAVDD